LGQVIQVAEAVGAEVHLLSVVEEPGTHDSWLEALTLVDETTGEFGVADRTLRASYRPILLIRSQAENA
jgi:hypothetical protein